MNALRQALADYLAVRRVLGYKLVRTEKLLAQFLTYVEGRGERHLTIETALAWASLSPESHRSWAAKRLSVVRCFATHLRGIDPATEVPPVDLLPGCHRRATPYLYSETEITALITAAETLSTSHRQATYRTLLHSRHQAALWQCPADLPQAGLPRRPQASLGLVSAKNP